MSRTTSERATDLIDALQVLARHRHAEAEAYRAVHAAATAAVTDLHADLLDPRAGGDFDAAAAQHADLARRLRDLPRPSAGQPRRPRGSEPLLDLLTQARRTQSGVDGLLGDVARDVVPQIERAVRDGLRDLFGGADRSQGSADRSQGSDDVWADPAPETDAGEDDGRGV